MTADAPAASTRRDLMKTAGIGLGAAFVAGTAPALAATPTTGPSSAGGFWTNQYWAQKGADIKLAVYRKRMTAPAKGEKPLPVLFLVHGSSTSALTSYDLTVPGAGEYSLMNVFARAGYDVWTMDHEGYGRSTVTAGNSDIASGVADLEAASAVVLQQTGQKRPHFFGESSGGLRAAAFASAQPERVDRLVLTAFTYTGKGSRTLGDRAKQLDFYRTHNRRPRDAAMIRSIMTRDKPGTSDPRVGDAMVASEMKYGDTVPTGTYLDMTAHLPIIDPAKVLAPTLLMRGEYDGIATEEDILDFLHKLPHQDKQYTVIPSAAHGLGFSINRQLMWHVTTAWLTMPPHIEV